MLEIMASTSSTAATYDLLRADVPSSATQELRRPLIAIHGTLRLVAAGALGPLTPEASELLAIAGRSCAEVIGLLGEVLDRDQSSRDQSS